MTEEETFHRPSEWESHTVFRETFLTVRLEPDLAELLRKVGQAIYFESQRSEHLPEHSGDLTAALLGAARDLRQIEGFLRTLGQGGNLSTTAKYRVSLAQVAADSIAPLASAFEEALRS